MSNACSYGEERLVGLLYEDGDHTETAEVRAHLGECAECREELEHLVCTRDLLSAWPNAVNAPRMVYVNERSGFWARVRRWAGEVRELRPMSILQPVMAAAAVVLFLVAATALLDVRVAPDGRLRIGLAGGAPAGGAPAPGAIGDLAGGAAEPAAITREELEESLTQAVGYMEEIFRSRSDEERRLLIATIDERMQEQGVAMSDKLRGAVDDAFSGIQQQHENDLGLVFSAIDELGVVTGTELQRMNTILASLTQPRSPYEEE